MSKLSTLKSRLTNEPMKSNQMEFTSRKRVFAPNETYTVQSGTTYRVLAVSAVHSKYGQIVLAETV
jgi:hypothetical protein